LNPTQSKVFRVLRRFIDANLLRRDNRQQAEACLKIHLIISPHLINPHDVFEVPGDNSIRTADVGGEVGWRSVSNQKATGPESRTRATNCRVSLPSYFA
jgi:hypothetical protein